MALVGRRTAGAVDFGDGSSLAAAPATDGGGGTVIPQYQMSNLRRSGREHRRLQGSRRVVKGGPGALALALHGMEAALSSSPMDLLREQIGGVLLGAGTVLSLASLDAGWGTGAALASSLQRYAVGSRALALEWMTGKLPSYLQSSNPAGSGPSTPFRAGASRRVSRGRLQQERAPSVVLQEAEASHSKLQQMAMTVSASVARRLGEH